MKKPLPIEKLIRWAYTHELPKERGKTFLRGPGGFGMPWGSITKTGMQGGTVDEPDIANRYGLVPDFTATNDPHPDAVMIWGLVQDLNVLDVIFGEEWNPLTDLGDLGEDGLAAVSQSLGVITIKDRSGTRHLVERFAPAFVIQMHASTGAPEWECEKPVRKLRRLSDGRIRWYIRETVLSSTGSFEIEVDGYDYTRRMPKPGGYKKSYLDPDPVKAAINRAEYAIWHSAISMLAEEIGDRLESYVPLPTELSARPWEGNARPAPRVLIDLRTPQPNLMREPRPTAGPPPYRGLEKPKKERDAA